MAAIASGGRRSFDYARGLAPLRMTIKMARFDGH